MDTVLTPDLLLYCLDKDTERTIEGLRESAHLPSLALALSYGNHLPQGSSKGDREQRRYFIESERAKRVREQVAQVVVDVVKTDKDLMKLVRIFRKRHGSRNSLLKSIVRRWHDLHPGNSTVERMAC